MIKTKYTQLVKVKKQRVDTIENEIAILNSKRESIKNEIDRLALQISSLQKPKDGKFGIFLSVSYSFGKLHSLKKSKEEVLSQKESELHRKQEEYKVALMDYEKIKYLEDLLVGKKLDKIKKDEQKLLDELSQTVYKRRIL